MKRCVKLFVVAFIVGIGGLWLFNGSLSWVDVLVSIGAGASFGLFYDRVTRSDASDAGNPEDGTNR